MNENKFSIKNAIKSCIKFLKRHIKLFLVLGGFIVFGSITSLLFKIILGIVLSFTVIDMTIDGISKLTNKSKDKKERSSFFKKIKNLKDKFINKFRKKNSLEANDNEEKNNTIIDNRKSEDIDKDDKTISLDDKKSEDGDKEDDKTISLDDKKSEDGDKDNNDTTTNFNSGSKYNNIVKVIYCYDNQNNHIVLINNDGTKDICYDTSKFKLIFNYLKRNYPSCDVSNDVNAKLLLIKNGGLFFSKYPIIVGVNTLNNTCILSNGFVVPYNSFEEIRKIIENQHKVYGTVCILDDYTLFNQCRSKSYKY